MAKILIVEDDAMNRDVIARRLAFEGHQVVVAIDGRQAIALAMSEHPDIILMDMGLPVLSGWQATYQIKNTAETQTIPIVALTAYALAEERLMCLQAGCDEYETKPIDFDRLRAKIAALLEKGFQARMVNGDQLDHPTLM
jgi:two-component system cell cycle response regulator DivK